MAAVASAQEELVGAGTPNFVPRFIGKHRLANSNIFEAGRHIRVNTRNPQATLDVESTHIRGVLGKTSSTGAIVHPAKVRFSILREVIGLYTS